MLTGQEVNNLAADLIEEHGWTQNQYEDPNTGGYCVLGAMDKVEPFNLGHGEAIRLLTPITSPHYGLVSWNDDPARTKEEVIAALRST